MNNYELKWLHTGLLAVNTYILIKDGKAAIIDPGGSTSKIIKELKDSKVELTHILITHGHFDHIGAVGEIKELSGASIYIHAEDADMLISNIENLSQHFGIDTVAHAADVIIKDGDIIPFGDGIRVLHTPGHTRGGVCFDTGEWLFAGDTLFHHNIGRADFPGGDLTQLINSIETKIYTLDGDRIVYPGHEEETSIYDEMDNNPYTNYVRK